MKTDSKISEKKKNRLYRDSMIVKDFAAMGGTITARTEHLAHEYKMACITIRSILKRNGMIGCDLGRAIQKGGEG